MLVTNINQVGHYATFKDILDNQVIGALGSNLVAGAKHKNYDESHGAYVLSGMNIFNIPRE